ncbi:hypothetical protein UFOVP190_412 [uncultured Caudovirales phage]|uniref:Uncharacterized protein n=1 Tax=uncultured Caudovirales phage TaxID=2100421 RepID=A0A6J7WKX3_9CAUD|nr:hypothetical protein UFOVP190_412 [uncultured Caudovirales phage]
MFINDLFTESNEMDTPEFQAALLAMKKRAAQEPPVDLKRLRQRMDAAERAEQAREKRKQERRAEVDENSWHDGSNSWSSEHDQWTKENSNNPVPVDSASAIPGRVREGAGVFNIGDQVLYKGQPAEVLAVDGTAATVYVPNWKAVPGMVDDTTEVDPASKFLNPMDPSVAEQQVNEAEGSLSEVDRRGFLKGLGAAAVAGVAEGIGDEDGENKDYALALAQYGMKVLQGMEKICQQIDALPEPKKSKYLNTLTDVEFAQSGDLVQYVIDTLGLKIDDFMEFQDAWEEEGGEPFYIWIHEWLEGHWDEFVAPWKKFTMKVLQGRGLGPTLHEAGVAEAGPGDINRLEHRGEEYNVYFNQRKGMYTARGTGQMSGQIQPEWFHTMADAIDHAEMEIGGYDEHDGVAESDPLANRDAYAKQHQQGQVYKTHYPKGENPFHKAGMKDKRSTKMSAYDISNTGPKGQLPESGVAEAAKQKTPGIALSKAYKKDFDGKKPGQDRLETALTGAYSKTGKPGGALTGTKASNSKSIPEQWVLVGQAIKEQKLTKEQIVEMFVQLEQNRLDENVFAGIKQAVSGAWNSLSHLIQDTAPVKNFEAVYNQAAEKLKAATGGDAGVMQYIEKYRAFAKSHPIAHAIVIAAVLSAAGVAVSAGGAGAATAAVSVLTAVESLFRGKNLFTSVAHGVAAGAVALSVSQLLHLLHVGGGPAVHKALDLAADDIALGGGEIAGGVVGGMHQTGQSINQTKRHMRGSMHESTNYWHKLQAERNTRINSLIAELKESIK